VLHSFAGPAKAGVIYKLDRDRHYTVLHDFTGKVNGGKPQSSYAGVALDSEGNLYGTTLGGSGAGTVYKVDTAGVETVLHSFTGGSDGGQPAAGLILDSAGSLYGTTRYGGKYNHGVIFEIQNQ